MNLPNSTCSITQTHAAIFALQSEMKSDTKFKDLCGKHGLPWNFSAGYEPRWYNGPLPDQVQVLVLMAEPGAISKTEKQHLGGAIGHSPWIGTKNLKLQENYWLGNLYQLCEHIWPEDTESNMDAYLGGS